LLVGFEKTFNVATGVFIVTWDVQVQHPDFFLTRLYERFPETLIEIILQQSEDLKNPPMSVAELLGKLSEQVPEFVSRIRENF
jgi:hypothetical protein